MPSPFPGMNPYLEKPGVWHDFHQTFIPASRAALIPQVVPRYFVRVQDAVYLRPLDADDRGLLGSSDVDVGLVGPSPAGPGTATLAAPMQTTLVDVEAVRESYLEVVTIDGRRLVTVIELLSPSNKNAGDDRDQYLRKRQRLLAAGVNVVEIDLLRGGRRLSFTSLPACDYCAAVCRAVNRPTVGVWPVGLRDRLPEIAVPLANGDPDARLDLQAVLHRVYDESGYAHTIYRHPPVPKLSPADAEWAAQFLPPGGAA